MRIENNLKRISGEQKQYLFLIIVLIKTIKNKGLFRHLLYALSFPLSSF